MLFSFEFVNGNVWILAALVELHREVELAEVSKPDLSIGLYLSFPPETFQNSRLTPPESDGSSRDFSHCTELLLGFSRTAKRPFYGISRKSCARAFPPALQ